MTQSRYSICITLDATEMPRCFSISIQSEVAWREALRAFTEPAIWIAPENSSSFSVSVVLPASGWEMMAKVRRRATSTESGDRDGDSEVTAMSDMRLERLAGKTGLSKPHLMIAEPGGQSHIGSGRTTFRFTAFSRGRPCMVGGLSCLGLSWPLRVCWKLVGRLASNTPMA